MGHEVASNFSAISYSVIGDQPFSFPFSAFLISFDCPLAGLVLTAHCLC